MSDYDTSIHTNPDAKAWAEFFLKTLTENKWSVDDIDEGLMISWFANAMMAMHDHIYTVKLAEHDAEVIEKYFQRLAKEYKDHGLSNVFTGFAVAQHIEAQLLFYIGELHQKAQEAG